MALTIEDMQGKTATVDDAESIQRVLNRRYGNDVNEFWISQEGERYPVIALLVNGDLASLDYFPEDGSAGYKSVGNIQGLKKGEFTNFAVTTPTARQPVLNDSIVSVATAANVIEEFRGDRKLPTSIEWLEL